MHPELVAISNVWQPDHRIDTLRAEHETLSAAVAKAVADKGQAEPALAAAVAELDRLKKEERTNTRSLDEYSARRKNTQALIDTGAAGDYAAAERQIQSCIGIIDDLENKGLELLEGLDAAEATVRGAQAALAAANEAVGVTRRQLAERDQPIRVELAATLKVREEAWTEVPAYLTSAYVELRRRKRRVLVNVGEDGDCTVCHMRIPPQKLVEIRMERANHTCPGCQGWILP